VSRPVILRPDAEDAVRHIYAELESVRPGLGEQFAGRLRDVLERIEAMPRCTASSGATFGRYGYADSATSFTTSWLTTAWK
jgi:hypothetical protein